MKLPNFKEIILLRISAFDANTQSILLGEIIDLNYLEG